MHELNAKSPPPPMVREQVQPPVVLAATGLPTANSKAGARIGIALLAIFTVLYALFLSAFYEPAHPGGDQNGYMLTARLLTEYHKLHFTPKNPLQFAGNLIIQTPHGEMYAKYPPGMGVLGAVLRVVINPSAMYLVDPLCVILALIGSYFIFRRMLDPFMAMLGVIWLAINPVTLTFANDADSHGAALGFTVLGFWALFSWWEKGGWWRAVLTGMLLGFCCWIRYTEFLWAIPLLAVAILRWRNKGSLRQSLLAMASFALPVLILAAINWQAFGAPWRTGYWFCREQTGFALRYLLFGSRLFPKGQGNWLTAIEQFENIGLFLLFPVALVGLCKLPTVYRRFGLVILLWVVPTSLVYLLYYWAPTQDNTVVYLRFFLDTFPALIMVSLWVLADVLKENRVVRALAVGLLTALTASYSLHAITPRLLTAQATKITLLQTRQMLVQNVKPGSVVFAPSQVCNFLNAMGGFQLYDTGLFTPQMVHRMTFRTDRKGPDWLEKSRAVEYRKLLSQRTSHGKLVPKRTYMLRQMELTIVQKAWRQGKQVVIIAPTMQLTQTIPTAQFLTMRRLGVIDQPSFIPNHKRILHRWTKLNPRLLARMKQRRALMRQWSIIELLPARTHSGHSVASALQ